MIVADTSVLNYLILINRIEVLRGLYGTIIIPDEVRTELLHPRTPASVRNWVNALPEWVQVQTPTNLIREFDIDAGERAAISLALERGIAEILIDERKGTEAARQVGLRTLGTIGVLDLSDMRGLLNSEDALDDLLKTRFQISAALVLEVRERSRARKQI